MTRRLIELLVALTRAILMTPLAAAQQPANVHLIGILGIGFPLFGARRPSSPFLQKLRMCGWEEGHQPSSSCSFHIWLVKPPLGCGHPLKQPSLHHRKRAR
jgi:hypothetical protein